MKDGGLLTLSDLMLLLPPRCADSEPLTPKVPFILVNMHYSNKNSDDFGNSKNSNDLLPTEMEVPSMEGIDSKFVPSTFSHPLPSISNRNNIHHQANHGNGDMPKNPDSTNSSHENGHDGRRILSTSMNAAIAGEDQDHGNHGISRTADGNQKHCNGNDNLANPNSSLLTTHPSESSSSSSSSSTTTTTTSSLTTTNMNMNMNMNMNTSITNHSANTPAVNPSNGLTATTPATTTLPPIIFNRNYFDVISLHRSGGRNSQSLGVRTLERCRYIVVHNRRCCDGD